MTTENGSGSGLPNASTRRDFQINLGAGASISGFFLLRGNPHEYSGVESKYPQLKGGIQVGVHTGRRSIKVVTGDGEAICAVNRAGEEVLRFLDGKHTVEQISKSLSNSLSIPGGDVLDARIAEFLVELGMLGFLRERFVANTIESSDNQ